MALIIGWFQRLFSDGYLNIDTWRSLFSLILIVHYVLSIKMVKGKLISLNTRGISKNQMLESFKCHDYYCLLIKQNLEKPSEWVMLKKEFSFDDKQVSEAFQLPVRVANEPYLRSFQYKVLNSILFTDDRLCKIGYISEPNCTFCHQLTETIPHILFGCSFSNSFWHEVNEKNLSQSRVAEASRLHIARLLLGFLRRRWIYLII